MQQRLTLTTEERTLAGRAVALGVLACWALAVGNGNPTTWLGRLREYYRTCAGFAQRSAECQEAAEAMAAFGKAWKQRGDKPC